MKIDMKCGTQNQLDKHIKLIESYLVWACNIHINQEQMLWNLYVQHVHQHISLFLQTWFCWTPQTLLAALIRGPAYRAGALLLSLEFFFLLSFFLLLPLFFSSARLSNRLDRMFPNLLYLLLLMWTCALNFRNFDWSRDSAAILD